MRLLDWLRNEPAAQRRPTLEEQIATILDREERALQRLGIPLPPMRESVRESAAGLLLPIFDLSQYLFLPVEFKAGDYVGYFVGAEPRKLENARFVLENSGAHELVTRFDGLWLNRDPYALHKALNWQGTFGGALSPKTDLTAWLKLPPPLWAVPALRPLEIYERITRRQRLFSAIVEGAKFPIGVENMGLSRVACNDALQLAATVRAKAMKPSGLPGRWTTVQIAPSETAMQPAYDCLLEGLREQREYFVVEVIADPKGLRLQLAFRPQQHESIQREIERLLPGALVRPVERERAQSATLYCMTALPNSPLGTFDTSCDRCDGLAQLLSSVAVGHTCCVQFVLAPLELGYFLRFREELRLVHLPGHCSERIQVLAAKFPGWLTGIRLFASQPEIVQGICEGWLRIYESETRRWIFGPPEFVPEIDRKLDVWDVLEPGELVSIIYGSVRASSQ